MSRYSLSNDLILIVSRPVETSVALFYTKPFEIFTSLDPFSKMIILREPRQELIDKITLR